MMRNKVKYIVIILVAFVCIVFFGANQAYRLFVRNIHSTNQQSHYIYITPKASLDTIVKLIQEEHVIESTRAFRLHARLLGFDSPKSGHYRINSEESNLSLIRKLRNGEQTPVRITFNNVRTKEQLVGRLATQLMIDSVAMISVLNDSALLAQYGFVPWNVHAMFLPDTYEVFWNISAENLLKRMYVEYTKFWNAENRAQADAMGLTPFEVSTLASIVEEESNLSYEKPIIAGLYYNRLQINMPLQSDPTVKYAVGDVTLKRILYKHLEVESPYNTYKYVGLPPGPIRIPSKNGLLAVLNYARHKYYYMCAKDTFNGEHYFSTNLRQHTIYAARYQRALNQQRIYK